MPDRPPVRLNARLPEGHQNGLGVLLLPGGLLEDPELPVYLLAHAVRRKAEHDDETGLDGVLLRLVSVEVLPGGKILDAGTAAQLMHALRSERVGDNPLDFDSASDADWAQLNNLRAALAEWRDEQGMTDVTLGQDVIATVPGAGAGWRDEPLVLAEYLRTKGAIADPPAGEPEPDEPGSDQ